jgi:hypothetical protein
MVFLGAFLLFEMEPLVGRLLMPYFGGTAHVWLTCLMFFQAMLFIGYLYAHLLTKKLGIWHLLLLALPLINFPLKISAFPDPHAPVLNILATLLCHIALPFIVLSTTAVVAQAWFSDSSLGKNYEPYPLYAASNAGSLIALLGYSFIIEPLIGLRLQSLIWTNVYFVYALMMVAAWFILRPSSGQQSILATEKEPTIKREPILRTTYLKWLLLSSLPSALLLSITNFITLEVGSFPLIWIAPLSLYLFSFVVTFRNNGGAPKFLKMHWPEFCLLSISCFLAGVTSWLGVIVNLAILFSICLTAHGTLYEIRPPASCLTNFYLSLALGGWLGGAFVSLVVPVICNGLYDYPFLLILCAAAFWWCRDISFINYWSKSTLWEKVVRTTIMGIILVLASFFSWMALNEQTKYHHRNFYGTCRIVDELPNRDNQGGLRVLLNGMTVHGSQFLNPDLHRIPTTYFYIGSGVSDVFEITRPPRRIGIIGLGTGCIAAYAKPGDTITYFEIDPDNEKIAREWFTYLDDSRGNVNVVAGDGRLSILKSAQYANEYEIIIVDAFTGGGIPAHLLTKEAIEVYLSRLSSNGLIVFHITNRYYDLQPVLKSISTELKLSGAICASSKIDLKSYQYPSLYVVLKKNSAGLEPLINRGWKQFSGEDGVKCIAPWTDNYINILAALRITDSLHSYSERMHFPRFSGHTEKPEL